MFLAIGVAINKVFAFATASKTIEAIANEFHTEIIAGSYIRLRRRKFKLVMHSYI